MTASTTKRRRRALDGLVGEQGDVPDAVVDKYTATLLGDWCRTVGMGRCRDYVRGRRAGGRRCSRVLVAVALADGARHGVLAGLRAARRARSGVQLVAIAHPAGWRGSPTTAKRARLVAAASRQKSALTFVEARTRARRPPCVRHEVRDLALDLGRVCV